MGAVSVDQSAKCLSQAQKDAAYKEWKFGNTNVYDPGCSMVFCVVALKKDASVLWNQNVMGSGGINWQTVADKNNKTYTPVSLPGPAQLYLQLRSGPVVVGVNPNAGSTHFVCVYKFSGDDENVLASGFTCYDPAYTGSNISRKLTDAFNYNKIASIRIYR